MQNLKLDSNSKNRWCADDVFLSVFAIVFFAAAISAGAIHFREKHSYLNSKLIILSKFLIFNSVALGIVILYSKVKTFEIFSQKFGFFKPKPFSLFVALFSGILLSITTLALGKIDSVHPHNPLFLELSGHASYFHAFLLLGPLPEEIVMRGYFYKALRNDFSVGLSLFFIIVICSLSHFHVVHASFSAAFGIYGMNIAVSLMREKGWSTWNCVFCHFAYNLMLLT